MRVIPATFANASWFASGLTPSITIYRYDELNQILVQVISDTMTDLGTGNYQYSFGNYDKKFLYYYNIDGGSDELTSRYITGVNELDYYGNKDDWGSAFRGALVGIDKNIANMVVSEVRKAIKEIDVQVNTPPAQVDMSPIMDAIQQLNEKEIDLSDIKSWSNEQKALLTGMWSSIKEQISVLNKKLEELDKKQAKLDRQEEKLDKQQEKLEATEEKLEEIMKIIERKLPKKYLEQDQDMQDIIDLAMFLSSK